MGIVVDSSVLIDHLRGSVKATEFLETQSQRGRVLVPALAAWELWKGATTAKRRAAVHELLTSLEVDSYTPAMAQLSGELHRQHKREGRERPSFDLLIASHAIQHGLPIATRDRDCVEIPALEVVFVGL